MEGGTAVLWLVVVLSAVATPEEVVDLNDIMDGFLEEANRMNRGNNRTSIVLQPAILNENFAYSDGQVLGFDSFYRTGNCTLLRSEKGSRYDLHYGLRLLVLFFSFLELNGQKMSAYCWVRNNSLRVRFSVSNGTDCTTALEDFYVEDLGVELGSSHTLLDGTYLSTFQSDLRASLNVILHLMKEQLAKAFHIMCLEEFEGTSPLSALVRSVTRI